nr:uncharacterized protein LOC109153087 [Ipomoea batatas]
MAASLNFSLATAANFRRTTLPKRYTNFRTTIRCSGRVEWDPEGVLGPPQSGHIARLEFTTRLEKDKEAREAFERHVREEKERRRALRESRAIPDKVEDLVEYFLDTEAQEIEFEIARLRPRLNKDFFDHLKLELGKLRFAVSKTKADLVTARASLTMILTSKNVKATLLEMVEQNKINTPLLAILDENIASAHDSNQKEIAEYMEKIRAAVLKYITV